MARPSGAGIAAAPRKTCPQKECISGDAGKGIIDENSTMILSPGTSKVSRKMDVFYNPIMKLNRDLTILLLEACGKKAMSIADPLAGSGIRSLRMLKELRKDFIKQLCVNDYGQDFFSNFGKNWDLNFGKRNYRKIDVNSIRVVSDNNRSKRNFHDCKEKVLVFSQDANDFLLQSHGFDYIDIDPFGTPNPFLDSACKRLSRDSILAVTATDTSALAGTYPSACMRKYWAVPLRDELKHEVGLRILVRKVQLVAAQYEKALTPILSYSKEHYMRVFFRCAKGREKTDSVLGQHSGFMHCGEAAGPLWTGQLSDSMLLARMIRLCTDLETRKFLQLLKDENSVRQVGFFDIHAICKRHRLKKIPTMEWLAEKLGEKKIAFSRTHFSPLGIKAEVTYDEMLGIMAGYGKDRKKT